MQSRQMIPVAVVVVALLAVLAWRGPAPAGPAHDDGKITAARSLCAEWADRLDRRTTDTGTYVRHDGDTLPAADPWGGPLRVAYSMGGVAEVVEVRSIGPDGRTHTPDDIVEVRHAVNLKGVGTGINKGAEETSQNAAKGVVKGLVAGGKEVLGFGKKPTDPK